ncbi:probable 28S ribosomal protein S25, mitochondrial [Fopius arisanus]|uniref:Small ribosomal subunit protein mS25 n=1 Tax=Fopius arisanus TaxID=64838 RepID=A0A9R1T831_9HYME|nr:PREDICTED: probable 28S ribosomal protein S25, mitochondrial [Fopius arisanus]
MPFMIGKAPIRRTLPYLKAGRLVLKDNIQIMTINFNTFGEHHKGAKEFVFWRLPQVQYKNPGVQINVFKNMTPSPFIRCFYDTGKRMLIDVDGQTSDDIYEHLIRVIGKSQEVLKREAIAAEKKQNPANIGNGCMKHCICEVPGQLPCPSIVPLPYHMRGKYRNGPPEF